MVYENHMVRAEHEAELAIMAAITDNARYAIRMAPRKLTHYLLMIWCCEAWRGRDEPASLSDLATRATEMGGSMRRTFTTVLHNWSQEDDNGNSVLRITGDEVFPGAIPRGIRYRSKQAHEVKAAEVLGLCPTHGVEPSLLHERLDPRWLVGLRHTIGWCLDRGVTTTRHMAALMYLFYCEMAGSRYVAGQAIADYLGVDTRRITDALEPWVGDSIERRRSPGDERRVEFRLRVGRHTSMKIIEEYKWYLDKVFAVPEDFEPHKMLGLPSLKREGDLVLRAVPI